MIFSDGLKKMGEIEILSCACLLISRLFHNGKTTVLYIGRDSNEAQLPGVTLENQERSSGFISFAQVAC